MDLKKSIMAIVLGVDQSKVRLAGEGEKQKHGNTEKKALPVGQDKGDGGADSRDGRNIKYIFGRRTYETLNEFSVGQGKEAVINDFKSLSGITN